VSGSQDIARILFGSPRHLNLAVAPLYPNGWGGIDSDYGKVTVDYVEATVKYRLPAEYEVDCENGEDDDADGLTDCDDDDCTGDPACTL